MIYLKKNNETQIAYIAKNGNYEGKLSYKEGYEAGKAEGIEEGRNNPITTKEVYFSNGIKTSTHNTMVIDFNLAIPTSPLKGFNYIETTFFPYWNNGCVFGLQSSSSYLAYIQNEKLYIVLNNTNLVLERPCTYAKWHTLRIYTDRAVFDGEEVFYGETFETDDLVMACINRGGRGYYRGEIAYIKHTEDEQNTLMWVVPNPDAEQRTLIRVRKDETGWSRADYYMGIRLQIATANLPISESVVFVEGDGVCPELTELNVSENGRYEGSFNVVNVNVPDVNGSYDEGYNNGYNDGLNAGGDCPELTELNVSENGTYEGAYNIVNVDVPTEGGSCNLQERWLQYNSTDELTDGIFVDVHPEEGYDGMSRVVANIQPIMDYKYDEGYNEGKNEVIGSLNELNVTENGVYEGAYNKVNVNVPTEGEGDLTPSAVEKKFDTLAFRTENLYDGDIIMDKSKLTDRWDGSAEDDFIAYSQHKNSVVICEQGEFTSPQITTIENGALDWNKIEYFYSFTIDTFGVNMTRDTGSNILELHLDTPFINTYGIDVAFKSGCFATSNRLNKIVFYQPLKIDVEENAFEGVTSWGEVIVVGEGNAENRAKYDTLMSQLGSDWTLTFTDSYNG